jgi:hypothetical protein
MPGGLEGAVTFLGNVYAKFREVFRVNAQRSGSCCRSKSDGRERFGA